MAQTAACPSCGAPVVFQSAASIFAVCAYCQSTLIRHDQALEDIGKMAALVEDRSPLQLGTEGRWQGVRFALIGRIQNKYSQGVWNEWHLLFDDMRTGWLSEAGGEYVLTFLQHTQELLPLFSDLKIGQRFVMASRPWTVSNIETAECIAGQGELPFKVGAGYPLPAVDLRGGANSATSTGNDFATLDYSETPPLLFIGQAVKFADLKLSNLRQGLPIPTQTIEAQVFRCPSCGSPMAPRSTAILAIGCASCGAVVDAVDPQHQLISQALGLRDETYTPRIPLGSKGVLDGQPVEAIGFLVKQMVSDGLRYDWREYLLAAENGTYRWLTEYNGHWNIVDVLSNPPASSGIEQDKLRYGGQVFKHFASAAAAEVIQVSGEFTWRVQRGETCQVVDYVAPPLLLSCESSEHDLSWSQGRYVEAAIIHTAFKLSGTLPAPIGIYANQPNPWEETHRRVCKLFWKLGLLAIALQLLFLFLFPGKPLLQQELIFTPQLAEETVVTRDFEIRDKPKKVIVRNNTSLDNNWIGLNLTLVNKVSGAAWPTTRELGFYYGSDGGEGWSEGSREDEVVFLDIPPGTYYLAVDPDLAPEKPVAVRDNIQVLSGGAGWSNFIIVMIFLVVFPVFTRLRHAAFEARRWSESDHAPVSSDSDAEGDD